MIAALIALAVGASIVPTATESYRSSPPRRPVVEEQYFEPSASAWRASVIPALMQDFGERYIYADANRALAPPRADEKRVVFLGDSITDGWNLANAFPRRSFISRRLISPQPQAH